MDDAINGLATAPVAVRSTLSLINIVAHWRGRDKALASLYNVLQNLYNSLEALEQTTISEASTNAILRVLVSHCHFLCQEFERAMQEFDKQPRTGLRDWSKMEFRTGDINEFIDILAGYQATISVSLDTVTKLVQSHQPA